MIWETKLCGCLLAKHGFLNAASKTLQFMLHTAIRKQQESEFFLF